MDNNDHDVQSVSTKEEIREKVRVEKKPRWFSNTGEPLVLYHSEHFEDVELINWKKNFHFATFPLYEFGNWIPFVMSRWPCTGTGCGLLQVAFKSSKGKFRQMIVCNDNEYFARP